MNYKAALAIAVPPYHETPAGPELDALVSSVMGHEAPYSSDLLHAWRLLETLRSKGLSVGLSYGASLWCASTSRRINGTLAWFEDGYHFTSAPVAICLAFLKAAKVLANEPTLQEAA